MPALPFRFIVTAGLLFCSARLHSQTVSNSLTLFFNQSTPPAKADNLGNSFLKDSRGVVWLSSFEGAWHFNGLQWGLCPPLGFQDSTAAAHTVGSNVDSPFFEDKNGDIWFSTETAINRYEQATRTFQPFRNPFGSTEGHHPKLLFLEQKRFLWAAFDTGQVFRYDLQEHRWEDWKMNLRGGSTVPDTNSAGVLTGWIGHHLAGNQGKGLTYWPLRERGAPAAPEPRFFLQKHVIHTVVTSPRHTLVGDDRGLWAVNLHTGVTKRYMTELGGITSISQDRNRAYWLLSPSTGLWRWSGDILQAPQHVRLRFGSAGFDWHRAGRLHTDPDGILWVVYDGQGLAFAQPENSVFQSADLGRLARSERGLTEGSISCLCEGAGDDDVLVVFDNQALGVFNLQSRSLTWHTVRVSKPGPLVIFQCYRHRDGFSYLATLQGLFRQRGSSTVWEMLAPQAPRPPMIFWLFAHSDGRMLGASDSSVFEVQSEGRSVSFLPLHQRVSEGRMVFGDCDLQGNLFLNADDSHLSIIMPGKEPQKLPLSSFLGMAQDLKTPDLHWLATSTGLYGIDLPTLKVLDVVNLQSGLPDQYLHHLAQSAGGDLWASTNNGLFRYTPSTRRLRVFTVEDGLGENAFVEKSLLILPQSQLLAAANLDQINFAPLSNIGESDFRPPINLNELSINDKVLLGKNPNTVDALRLRHSQNTISLNFVGIDHSAPAKVRLQYRLSNYDAPGHWVAVPTGTLGFARYANLPPGHYQLQIQAANSDGVWSPDIKTLDITISPPWWKTTWFYALSSIAFALAAYGFYRYRLGQLRRRLEQRNRMTLLELDALRAQLNPHFISNSLVAINYYIRNNGVERVRQYVNTLARLMRDVLASARHLLVSVDDELAMLRNYVEVESGQFLQPIDFEITVEDGIPTAQIQMPGMLLQPFVENAIRHGLKPRQGQGRISVRVQRADNALLFTISDDGVGRGQKKQEAEPTDDDSSSRKSHGLDITRKRLHLYDQYQQTASRSGFEIVDLQRPDGTGSAGTEVRLLLCLPVKTE